MNWKPRDLNAFIHAFMASLPLGEVWPRDTNSELYKVVRGLMGVVARWADRTASFLIVEAFPPSSFHMLPDWERVLGLPEPCFPAAMTLEERRLQVREKLARRPGAQSRNYFLGVAFRLGYHEYDPSPFSTPVPVPFEVGRLNRVKIREFKPFMCGVSRCGDSTWRLAPPEMRFVWVVTVPGQRLTWWRFGASQCGVDPHLKIRRADDLECVLQRLKPAHTKLIFSYTGT